MDSLSHKDWLRLHDVLLDLHSAPSLAALPARVLAGMQRLFPYDGGSIQDDRGGVGNIPWFHGETMLWQPPPASSANANERSPRPPRGGRVMPPWGPNFLPLREAFFEVSAEKHPHTEYYRRTGDGAARRISEILSMRQLRRTSFFNEISRPQGMKWQLTIYMPLPPANTLILAAARRRLDFTARERLMLDLLRPHVRMMWLRTVRLENQQAELRQVASISTRLGPDDAATCSRTLGRQLKLTAREAEVLFWLSQGKTNAEIGMILNRGKETVKCHVANLLAKLGCETRTAAARTALEKLAIS